jgi:hypothetical protein
LIDDIEENLSVIRDLLERREIYRAVFARVALVVGTLSLFTAAAMYVNDEVTRFIGRVIRPREFAFAWIDIFILGAIALIMFLRKADAFPTARAKLAFAVIAPLGLIPAAFTGWFFATGYLGAAELELVTVWIAFYGLICLTSGWFAPRPIWLLGWGFLLTALSVPMLGDYVDDLTGNVPVTLMGLTFGLYHLVFAALNWTARSTSTKLGPMADDR